MIGRMAVLGALKLLHDTWMNSRSIKLCLAILLILISNMHVEMYTFCVENARLFVYPLQNIGFRSVKHFNGKGSAFINFREQIKWATIKAAISAMCSSFDGERPAQRFDTSIAQERHCVHRSQQLLHIALRSTWQATALVPLPRWDDHSTILHARLYCGLVCVWYKRYSYPRRPRHIARRPNDLHGQESIENRRKHTHKSVQRSLQSAMGDRHYAVSVVYTVWLPSSSVHSV